MQVIKALVIGMGVLLVVGIGLLGYGLYRTSVKSSGPQAVSVPLSGAGFGTVSVPVAPGSQVMEMRDVGGRLVVLLEEGGTRRIVVLDPATGGVAGSFVLSPTP